MGVVRVKHGPSLTPNRNEGPCGSGVVSKPGIKDEDAIFHGAEQTILIAY
jgi:hypothetical protein